MEDYQSRLAVLVEKIQAMKRQLCFLDSDKSVTVEEGKRYSKIVFNRSVYAFVDKTNGDVLKPASWKVPAKHARGNIYNEDYGFGCCGPYGVTTLR